ncbi:MAG: hypothetical protein ISS81_00895 [Candidatus Marinimicrobia bacterium]|nr:hypothetical protein [Candidatus Neomarinimicrobiota bacterium]
MNRINKAFTAPHNVNCIHNRKTLLQSIDVGLRIIDVSTPSNPYEVGYYETPGEACDVYSYAYVASVCSGLYILQFTPVSIDSDEK